MVVQSVKIKDQSLDQNPKTELKYRAHLSIEIIRFIAKLPQGMALKIIFDQLIRSITSVGANIVEAKSSFSKRELLHYFEIALKSANESKYWLAMLRELVPGEKVTLNTYLQELDEIAKILGTSILTMKGKRLL